jgi:Arc/MetJ family transcription regulator
MRTTVDLDETLVKKASEYSGITQKTALLEEALRRMIRAEAGRRLIALGGSDPNAKAAPRRRFGKAG